MKELEDVMLKRAIEIIKETKTEFEGDSEEISEQLVGRLGSEMTNCYRVISRLTGINVGTAISIYVSGVLLEALRRVCERDEEMKEFESALRLLKELLAECSVEMTYKIKESS